MSMGNIMSTVSLRCTVVTNPDSFVGFEYYIKAGDVFDADKFASVFRLNRADINADDILAVEHAANRLTAGECLMVSHSISHEG